MSEIRMVPPLPMATAAPAGGLTAVTANPSPVSLASTLMLAELPHTALA